MQIQHCDKVLRQIALHWVICYSSDYRNSQIPEVFKWWKGDNETKTCSWKTSNPNSNSKFILGLPEHSEEVQRFMTLEIGTQSCIQNSESIVNHHIRKCETHTKKHKKTPDSPISIEYTFTFLSHLLGLANRHCHQSSDATFLGVSPNFLGFNRSVSPFWVRLGYEKNVLVGRWVGGGEVTLPMKAHSANGPWNKSLNFIFPTKYVIPKSLKFSHWPSKKDVIYMIFFTPPKFNSKKPWKMGGKGRRSGFLLGSKGNFSLVNSQT